MSAEAVTEALAQIATTYWPAAFAWHVLLLGGLLYWALGRPLSRRAVLFAFALPLLSVSVFAWATGNPFNGLVFLVIAALALVAALRSSCDRPLRGPSWAFSTGWLLVIFAWIYPHFLPAVPAPWLYAAPLGLIPCPTLSLLVGLTLLGGGLDSRLWGWTLAVAGVFYAVVGAFFLGVLIDLVLLLGSVALIAMLLTRDRCAVLLDESPPAAPPQDSPPPA